MKKIYSLFVVLLILSVNTFSQGIYQFWSTTPLGGDNYQGVIYKTRFDGTGQTVVAGPEMQAPGRYPSEITGVVFENKIYYAIASAGIDNDGAIMEFDPLTNKSVKVADFAAIGGIQPTGNMVVLNNKLYGATNKGGATSGGTLYEFTPFNRGLTKKHDFLNASGELPKGNIAVFNGKLYGTCNIGGTNGGGLVYEFDPANSVYTIKQEL
ncbi:MAG: hypothetical protein H7Y31_11385, partial [Chitinophagaceae bacterium]|nr:hypothetical protein [Chitinophagaceae bacterium]